MDCAAVQDLVPGYALDALDPDDIATVDAHLADCAACAAQAAELERTASVLPYLARRATPPPDVKAALFSRIAQTHAAGRIAPRVEPVVSAPFRDVTMHAIPGATPTIPASRPIPATAPDDVARDSPRTQRNRSGLPDFRGLSWSSPRSWRGYRVPVATTAIPLVLALALVGGWAYSLYGDAAEARADQAMVGAFSGVLSGGDGNLYQLTSTADAPNAEGQFLANPDGNDGILMVSGLEPEQSGRTYEVWIEQDGRKFRYSALEVDQRGNGQMLIEVDGTFKRCRGVFVHLAPVNGDDGARPEVLWASLTTPGPANGGKQTEGDPEIGSSDVATIPLSSK